MRKIAEAERWSVPKLLNREEFAHKLHELGVPNA
jgi:hypothetical protein